MIAPVQKRVLLPTVPVHINEQQRSSRRLRRCEQLPHRVDRGVEDCRRGSVTPVQVHPRQGAPVVSVNYPVRIEHRNYFEDEVVSKHLCVGIISAQESQRPSQHVATVTFTWVDPGTQHYCRPSVHFFWVRCDARYCDQHAFISRQGYAHVPRPNEPSPLCPSQNCANVLLQIGVRVREAVREEHFLVGFCKIVDEAECAVF